MKTRTLALFALACLLCALPLPAQNPFSGGGVIVTPAPAPAAAPIVPSFITDVYSISPYGDVALLNKMYYASAETADALAQRYNAVPVQKVGTPEAPAPARWLIAEVSPGSPLLPPAGMRQSDPQKILLLMDLTPVRQWALQFPSGCIMNAGYLADFLRRMPEAQFPGLADKYIKANIAASCPGN